jgi:ABC-type iron transport system FetAB ATPase subunit
MDDLLLVRDLDCGSIRGASFALAAGECLGLMGPSGAGKTRLLRAVADLDPHAGQAWLAGAARADMPAHRWRRQVAYLPAESGWWADTVGEHLPDPGAEALAALGLEPQVLEWPVSRLSSGERQRLALLRLLAAEPRVLLLDEPTANLDPGSATRVEALLLRQREQGRALLWVSHDEAQLRRVSARALRVLEGRLEALAWT